MEVPNKLSYCLTVLLNLCVRGGILQLDKLPGADTGVLPGEGAHVGTAFRPDKFLFLIIFLRHKDIKT